MTHLRRILTLVTVCAASCFSQSLSPREFTFFNNLFTTIADPLADPTHGHDPTFLQQRETTEVARFGMNQTEADALHAAAQMYHAFVVQFQQNVAAIAQAKEDLSDSDRASLSALEAQQRAVVSQLAAAFLRTATTQTRARFSRIMSMDVTQ